MEEMHQCTECPFFLSTAPEMRKSNFNGNENPLVKLGLINSSKIAYLKWTNKTILGFLTTELKKRNWIKSQSDFTRLFGYTDINRRVHWNMEYKYELAYLLFKLKEDDFIRPVNSKGYFRIAERHIDDYSGKSLEKFYMLF